MNLEVIMKEYKSIKVKWDLKMEILNKTINNMAKEGWELVCMTTEPRNNLDYVITFCKEIH